jgi:hypothetical protein
MGGKMPVDQDRGVVGADWRAVQMLGGQHGHKQHRDQRGHGGGLSAPVGH